MELEKYTERSKGFIQAAQNLALRSGHQRLVPEHLLKILLDDKEGLSANLIRAAGGNPQAALQAVETELNDDGEGVELIKVEATHEAKNLLIENINQTSFSN